MCVLFPFTLRMCSRTYTFHLLHKYLCVTPHTYAAFSLPYSEQVLPERRMKLKKEENFACKYITRTVVSAGKKYLLCYTDKCKAEEGQRM